MLQYRYASKYDIALLVHLRIQFLEVKERHPSYQQLTKELTAYFETALQDNSCRILLAEQKQQVIATGIIFYYSSVPSLTNPAGKNAYLTSLYVAPDFRRKGIAQTILEKLIGNAKEHGCPYVMLSTSEMGRPLYEKYGFQNNENHMIYTISQ